MNVVYFETNYRNRSIYILTHIEINFTKYYLTEDIRLSLLL